MTFSKPLGEQMAALNTTGGDTSFAADQSNGLLNATCPARIQNNSNVSFSADTSSSSIGKWRNRPKREALKISPMPPIDEVPPPPPPSSSTSSTRKYGYLPSSSSSTTSYKRSSSDYKTRLCHSFRSRGWCPYNNNCTYAHGEIELQIPKRRSPTDRSSSSSGGDSSSYSRRPVRDRRDYMNRSSTTSSSSRRHDDGDRSQLETSFSRGGGASSRHRSDDHNSRSSSNHHHHRSSSSSENAPRALCHAFQRGNCRYGPRCRYLHQEQLPQFNANATMFAGPPPDAMATYYHQNTTQTYMMPYFIPVTQPPPPPQQQFVDLNQSVYLSGVPPPPTYYCAPQTPVMDQSGLMMSLSYSTEPQSIYSIPPPAIMHTGAPPPTQILS